MVPWTVTEKQSVLETHLPPQYRTKTEVMNTAALQASDVEGQDTYSQAEMRVKVVTDLAKNISMLSDTKQENALRFLIRAKKVCDLKLVTDV
jgi:hypothetical protein